MFYRPNFCCHCGEKIVRSRWTPLTSRRFCDFCEIEQKQHDLLPRAGVVIALLVGAAGMTAYFGGGDKKTGHAAQVSSSPSTAQRQVRENRGEKGAAALSSKGTSGGSNLNVNGVLAAANDPALPKQLQAPPGSSTEPVYYCGAMTKKGTPCTRRVKTKGRCWQHKGKSEFD
ncbi:MAG TPA: hypothetical protein VFZ23_00975 [Pyrinomonadaceae bacterium]